MKKPYFGLHRILLLLAALGLLAGCAQSPKQTPPPSYISILRKSVDFSVEAPAYSAQQNAVFVSAPAVLGAPESDTTGHILRLDPATLAVQAQIALPARGFGLALDDANKRLYVGLDNAAVAVLDTQTNQLLQTLALDQADGLRPLRTLAYDAKHQRLWVAGPKVKDSVLYIVNTRDLRLEKTLTGLGFLATAIAFDSAKDRAWVSNLQGQLHTINTQTLAVEKLLDIQVDEPSSLAFDAHSGRLWVADHGNEHAQLRASEGGLADYTQRSPKHPSMFRRDLHPGYRAAALDTETGEVLAWVDLGELSRPSHLVLDAQRGYLYASIASSGGAVAAIDIRSSDKQMPDHVATVPPLPGALALEPASGAVFVVTHARLNLPVKPLAKAAETIARVRVPAPKPAPKPASK